MDTSSYYSDSGAPWIALRNSKIPTFSKTWYGHTRDNLKPYHCEPLRRFLDHPPKNPNWEVIGVAIGMLNAWRLIEEEIWAIMQADPPVAITRSVRLKIFERDGFRCRLCGRGAEDGVKLEVDHKMPRAKGGTNHLSNLWTLCFDCNRAKRDRILEAAVEQLQPRMATWLPSKTP